MTRSIGKAGSGCSDGGLTNSHPHRRRAHSRGGGGGGKKEARGVPKGCLAVMVGRGEERRRFVIPVEYLNHPLFKRLLRAAEEEYGFDQKGPINIPCHVEEFCNVRGMIDEESPSHHLRHLLCFKV